MRLIQILFAAATLAGLAAVPQPAMAQGYSAQRLIGSLDDQILTATLTEIGATWETEESAEGDTIYSVTFENGLRTFAYFNACTDGGCLGLFMIATFETPSDISSSAVDDKIRAFNESRPAAKVYRGVDGRPMLQGYVIADNGITMGNLRSQIIVFADAGSQLWSALVS